MRHLSENGDLFQLRRNASEESNFWEKKCSVSWKIASIPGSSGSPFPGIAPFHLFHARIPFSRVGYHMGTPGRTSLPSLRRGRLPSDATLV